MRTFFVSMLAHNRVDVVEGAMRKLEETCPVGEHLALREQGIKVRPALFDVGYPLPSKEENTAKLLELCQHYQWEYFQIPNVSVTENHNVAIFEKLKVGPQDFYVTYDPDVRMSDAGWISKTVDILETHEHVVFVCAAMRFHDEEWCSKQHGRELHVTPKGTKYASYKCLIAWPMGTYKGEWLLNGMGRDFRAWNEVYGYGEHAMVEKMHKAKKGWLTLVDVYDDHLPAEEMYQKWKIESAARKTKIRFDEWLKERGLL